MPHVQLDYSANIQEKDSLEGLFASMHRILVKDLPTQIETCKSRAVENTSYYLGDGRSPQAFVHAEIKVAKGRTSETLHKTGEHLLALLKENFAKSSKEMNVKISLEIVELQDTYFTT